LYGLIDEVVGFDRAVGRAGTIGVDDDDACSDEDVTGNELDTAAEITGMLRSQGFGGETIVV
jgi:hypothetical protein